MPYKTRESEGEGKTHVFAAGHAEGLDFDRAILVRFVHFTRASILRHLPLVRSANLAALGRAKENEE
jgi:hypothetical protein